MCASHAPAGTASDGHVLGASLDQGCHGNIAMQQDCIRGLHFVGHCGAMGFQEFPGCTPFCGQYFRPSKGFVIIWFPFMTEILMTNLLDIQSQIEKLQKQANEIKAKEFDATVQDILAKMQAFGITVKDLQATKPTKGRKAGAKQRVAKVAKPSKRAGVAVAPKYRGPNGETWSGRGLMPKWLAALVAQGQSKESFAIAA